ncbi:hypothetical protein H7169_02575 [Candidatus Gracilibacteria bacterium]|nr:hypothetical protein [Candidatus Gracilibacteria bacterium]
MAEIFDSWSGRWITMPDLRDPKGHRAKALAQRVLDEKGLSSQPPSAFSGKKTSYTISTAVAKKAANITGME